jgi:hypothetical protein
MGNITFIIMTSSLILSGDVIAVYSWNRTELMDAVSAELRVLLMLKEAAP